MAEEDWADLLHEVPAIGGDLAVDSASDPEPSDHSSPQVDSAPQDEPPAIGGEDSAPQDEPPAIGGEKPLAGGSDAPPPPGDSAPSDAPPPSPPWRLCTVGCPSRLCTFG